MSWKSREVDTVVSPYRGESSVQIGNLQTGKGNGGVSWKARSMITKLLQADGPSQCLFCLSTQ